jgi:HlyD family secretion protein
MNKPIDPIDLKIQEIVNGGHAAGMMRRSRIAIVTAFVTVALVGFFLWTARSASDVGYLTAPVVRETLRILVTATGSLQPTKKVEVSSELSGLVKKVLVDYNARVAAGDTLAILDTEKLAATVNASRAKVVAAKARVKDAKATAVEKELDLGRKKRLAPSLAVAATEVDAAQAALDRARAAVDGNIADVDAAEATLRIDESNLEKARILSPISGVVLKRLVDPGQTVAAALQAPVMFVIAENLAQMEVQVDVDEADIGKISVGQRATFTVDAFPEKRFPATVRLVRYASETIQGVVTYKAILDANNTELLLRPGMTATADIVVKEVANATLIENAALRFTPRTGAPSSNAGFIGRLLPSPPKLAAPSGAVETGRVRSVWLLLDGKPLATQIEAGATDGKRTEIVSGLQTGDLAIVDQWAAAQ